MPAELERVAQPGDMPVQEMPGIPGLVLASDRVDDLLPTDRAILLQEQDSQNHPLLHRPEIYGRLTAPGPERAEDLESHGWAAWIAHSALPPREQSRSF